MLLNYESVKSGEDQPAMSGAVCDGEGHLIGIATMKPAPAPPAQAGTEMDPLMGITAGLDAKNRTPLPIVRPIDTVMKLVAQAKAKPATP